MSNNRVWYSVVNDPESVPTSEDYELRIGYNANIPVSSAGRFAMISEMLGANLISVEQARTQLQTSPINIEQNMLRGAGYSAVYIDELYQAPHDKLFYHCDGCASGGPCGN